MFKLLISLFLLPVLVGAAFAQLQTHSGYGESGCGLGSMLFGSQSGGVQIIAATTNSSTGTQTFGMSSGTSNCSAVFGKSALAFIEANKVALENDSARGYGESLSALIELYGCDDEDQATEHVQKNYGKIFESSEPSAIDAKLQSVLKVHNLSCEHLS